MINWILIYIIFAFILDMYLTYCYAGYYKNRNPDKDWTIVESNPIIRNFWKRFGLEIGSLLSFFVILIILSIIIEMVSSQWLYFIAGVYSMMVVYHFVNFNALRRIK